MSSETPTSEEGPSPARRCSDIDWATWQPTDVATLTFVLRPSKDGRPDDILLIRKKRGLGAGKINGPGGRLEGNETPEGCAVREVEEELHVTPIRPREAGKLYFQFVDGYGLECHVFKTWEYAGTARETEEAIPLWTPVDRIPFDEMWADDHLWFPHLLADRPFSGRFIFDGETMLDVDLEPGSP